MHEYFFEQLAFLAQTVNKSTAVLTGAADSGQYKVLKYDWVLRLGGRLILSRQSVRKCRFCELIL